MIWNHPSCRQTRLRQSQVRHAINTHLILWKPNGKANQNLESNLKFQAVTSEKQNASNLMKAQWKSKSKQRKQLKVSNTDLRKAINTHLILWKTNGKANQNQESNLKFQAVTSEKQHASNLLKAQWKSKSKPRKQLKVSSSNLWKATCLQLKVQWKSKSKRRKQLKVSNTDLRKAINTHLILWKTNRKANQNQESNLKFQVVTSEKQYRPS